MMGDTVSSDVSMVDADSPREEGAQGQAATLDDTAATAQSGGITGDCWFIQLIRIGAKDYSWSRGTTGPPCH